MRQMICISLREKEFVASKQPRRYSQNIRDILKIPRVSQASPRITQKQIYKIDKNARKVIDHGNSLKEQDSSRFKDKFANSDEIKQLRKAFNFELKPLSSKNIPRKDESIEKIQRNSQKFFFSRKNILNMQSYEKIRNSFVNNLVSQKKNVDYSSIPRLSRNGNMTSIPSLQEKPKNESFNSEILKFQKFKSQVSFLAKLHNISPIISNQSSKFKAFVGKGNNGELLRSLIKNRNWWQLTEQKNQSQFVWTQCKDKSFFCRDNKQKCIHNHFIKNQYLGNKKTFFYMMKDYYVEEQSKDLNNFLPLTFHIVNLNDHQWPKFEKQYHEKILNDDQSNNLWIVKPGQNSNRGHGIKICSKIGEIYEILSQNDKNSSNKQRHIGSFIIQQYISKPFLFNKRKFDIRCFILIVKLGSKSKGYWCKQGYIRTCGNVYEIQNYQNNFIHLTNDAIQNKADSYGKFQKSNKLSFKQLQVYLDSNCSKKFNFKKQVYPQLKQMSLDVIKASAVSIGQENAAPVFEIFGLDYMIDQNFKPWLIEVNTNPCLETPCSLLSSIITKMVDDALKLTIDVFYPPSDKIPLDTKFDCRPQESFELIFDSSDLARRQEN